MEQMAFFDPMEQRASFDPMNQDIVDSLSELLAGINRKIGLARTSAAYYKGTNKATIAKLVRQQHALLTVINRMD